MASQFTNLTLVLAASLCLIVCLQPAFVPTTGLRPSNLSRPHGNMANQPMTRYVENTAARPEAASRDAAVLVGIWALGAALSVVNGRRSSKTVVRAESEAKEEVKEMKPFNALDPSTYENFTMDDVKKYGAAGTLAYVVTELVFWAVAFPTEAFAFYETQGRWPDFSNDGDKAAVLGLVFAASNIARAFLPLRFGAALAVAPWLDENVMPLFNGGKKESADSQA